MSDGRSWQPGHNGPLDKHSLLTAMADHIGKHRGITGKKLVELIINGESRPATERHLRELIVKLRMEGFHICGYPGTGYYMAKNDKELNESCLFLHDRAMTSLQQVAAMKRVSLPDLKGQLRLAN